MNENIEWHLHAPWIKLKFNSIEFRPRKLLDLGVVKLIFLSFFATDWQVMWISLKIIQDECTRVLAQWRILGFFNIHQFFIMQSNLVHDVTFRSNVWRRWKNQFGPFFSFFPPLYCFHPDFWFRTLLRTYKYEMDLPN